AVCRGALRGEHRRHAASLDERALQVHAPSRAAARRPAALRDPVFPRARHRHGHRVPADVPGARESTAVSAHHVRGLPALVVRRQLQRGCPARQPLMGVLVFWWILLFLVQGAERVFLLREAARVEPPTPAVLGLTLLTGARADLILATLAVAVAALGAVIVAAPLALVPRRRHGAGVAASFRSSLRAWCWALAVVFLLVLTVDMGYYGYNRQHLDAVFFEYVDEMLSRAPAATPDGEATTGSRQAIEQTRAELGDAGKWTRRLAAFALLQAAVIAGWWWLFRRRVAPALAQWRARAPAISGVALGLCFLAGATGLHYEGPLAIARVGISSTTYYALAQSPIWQTAEGAYFTFNPDQQNMLARAERLMPLPEAIALTRRAVAPAAVFSSDEFPLVHATDGTPAAPTRRLNVLLIFIEALDRRFVGPQLSPFLDRWGREAIVFDNFFS